MKGTILRKKTVLFSIALITIICCLFAVTQFKSKTDIKKFQPCFENGTLIELKQEENSNLNVENTALSYDDVEIPSYYCLRDTDYMPVNNQSTMGLCWAFSIIKAVESSLIKQTGEAYNFSEAWLAICKAMEDASYIIGDGGNSTSAINLIKKYGLVLEEDCPYEVIYELNRVNYKDYYNYYKQFASFEIVNRLNETNLGVSNKYEDKLTTSERIETVKKHLLQYGAMSVSMNTNSCVNDGDEINAYLNLQLTKIVNGFEYLNTDHAVTLIGWEDDFSIIVDGNNYTGAWICLNSWGNDSTEMFYILYDDVTVLYHAMGFGLNDNSYADIQISDNGTSSIDNFYKYQLKKNVSYVSYNKISTKNVYFQQDNVSINYSVNTSYSSYNITTEVLLNGVISDDLNVSFSKASNSISVTENVSNYGNYVIKIYFDKENDGVVDNTQIKQIFVLSTIGIDGVITYDSFNNNQMFQNKNRNNNEIYLFTKNSSIDVFFNISSYSKLSSISSAYMQGSYYSSNSYAKGFAYLTVQAPLITGSSKETTITFKDNQNNTQTLKIVVYKISSSDSFANVLYNTNLDTSSLMKKVPIGTNFSNFKIPNLSKDGYNFDGWYTDSALTNALTNNNVSLSNTKVATETNLNYADYGSGLSRYSIVLYPKFTLINSLEFPSSQTLTDGSYKVYYNQTISLASGGNGTITYSVISGELPSGLTFNNGTVSGTPTVAKTCYFTVQAQDALGLTANSNVTLIIQKQQLQYNITEVNANYGEDIKTIEYSLSNGTIHSGDDVQITPNCSVSKWSDVGHYLITLSCNNENYKISFNEAYYHVNKATLLASDVKVENYNAPYDGRYHKPSAQVLSYSNIQFTIKLVNSYGSTTEVNQGLKDFTNGNVTYYFLIQNYNFNDYYAKTDINITKRNLTVDESLFVVPYNFEYQEPNIKFVNLVDGETVDYICNHAQKQIGRQSFTIQLVSSEQNYSLEKINYYFEITKIVPTDYQTPIFEEEFNLNNVKKLSDIQLPSNFIWENPNEELKEGKNSYYVTYTPSNTSIYQSVNGIEIELTARYLDGPEIITPVKEPIDLNYNLIFIVAGCVLGLVLIIVVTLKIKPSKSSEVTIIFHTNCALQVKPIKVKKNVVNALPQPYKPFQKFSGWYQDKDCKIPYVNNGMDKTLHLYAKWEQFDKDVKYNFYKNNNK